MADTTPIATAMGDAVREERATCPQCGNEFARRVIMLDGRPLPEQRLCEGCRAKEDARVAAARDQWAADRAAQSAELTAAERAERAERARVALNVPALWEGVSLTRWELFGTEEERKLQQRVQAAGLRYLSEWPRPTHPIMVLRGGPGTGKGHWTWSIAQTVVRLGDTARVTKCADLVRRLRRSWQRPELETEEESLELFRRPGLLVIDEVSQHAFYGQQIHQHLYDVLDHRLEWRRPTLITTNEDHAGLEAILRKALWSRLYGSGGVLEFGEADYRIWRRHHPSPAPEEPAPS